MIDEFYELHSDITGDITDDRPTDDEWATIFVIKDFLEKLLMLTMAYESKESTLDLVFPTTDYILELFESMRDAYADNPIFALMFNSS